MDSLRYEERCGNNNVKRKIHWRKRKDERVYTVEKVCMRRHGIIIDGA